MGRAGPGNPQGPGSAPSPHIARAPSLIPEQACDTWGPRRSGPRDDEGHAFGRCCRANSAGHGSLKKPHGAKSREYRGLSHNLA